jgi:hypothetical protein
MSDVGDSFRKQAQWCEAFGSRFMRDLLHAMVTANAVSLRVAGALHAAVLTGKDATLAAAYPAAKAGWSMEEVWPLAHAFLMREQAWVTEFMTRPPQTNETGRATGLAAGFLWLAARARQPFHMLELGASAGLNLNWNRFRYAYPPWAREEGDGPLIPTQVTGSPPAWRDIEIASRAACDANPLDPHREADRLRLAAYVWPDQIARLERLEAAMQIAAASGSKVEKADAAVWVADHLGAPKAGTTVVYHSVFYQYPPRETRHAIREAIETAGTRATAERQLAWVRFEPESIINNHPGSVRYILDVVHFDGAARTETTLAIVDPHGRTMEWIAP